MAETRRSGPPRKGRQGEDWSHPVSLGGGWRLQYYKATGEEFAHYRLLPPPNACKEGTARSLPRITAFDTLRVLPWLQRLFGGPEGPRIFRPMVCNEPYGAEKVQKEIRAVDAQARVWAEREHP